MLDVEERGVEIGGERLRDLERRKRERYMSTPARKTKTFSRKGLYRYFVEKKENYGSLLSSDRYLKRSLDLIM